MGDVYSVCCNPITHDDGPVSVLDCGCLPAANILSFVNLHALTFEGSWYFPKPRCVKLTSSEDGSAETKTLAKHNGRAHTMALKPDPSGCICLSCTIL